MVYTGSIHFHGPLCKLTCQINFWFLEQKHSKNKTMKVKHSDQWKNYKVYSWYRKDQLILDVAGGKKNSSVKM